MSTINDGGAAFPQGMYADETELAGDRYDGVYVKRYLPIDAGMTLRDYFAAKAMQVIRADAEFILRNDPDQVADRAYELADAMLKAREQQ